MIIFYLKNYPITRNWAKYSMVFYKKKKKLLKFIAAKTITWSMDMLKRDFETKTLMKFFH